MWPNAWNVKRNTRIHKCKFYVCNFSFRKDRYITQDQKCILHTCDVSDVYCLCIILFSSVWNIVQSSQGLFISFDQNKPCIDLKKQIFQNSDRLNILRDVNQGTRVSRGVSKRRGFEDCPIFGGMWYVSSLITYHLSESVSQSARFSMVPSTKL